ncbi:hypothetical protein [Streptomyces sp. NPDC088254]|uniref:hypothetical protein n=1 Tax=Streptomyces sp. NPDC088254 TaxID=3365847 RepID=UPI00381EB29C
MLTSAEVAAEPALLTRRVGLGDGTEVVFRPLTHADAEGLAEFLRELSPESRRFSTFDGYDLAFARELCDATARYDS